MNSRLAGRLLHLLLSKKIGTLTKGFLIRAFIVWVHVQAFAWQAQAQQPNALWHNKERQLHYRPYKDGFELVEGRRRFNRALYGGNTAFRVEAGDLPEFALYLPGMGGNIRFGLKGGGQSKWIIDADSIETFYRPERIEYVLHDAMLANGRLKLQAVPLFDDEGFIIKITSADLPPGIELVCVYGGVSGKKFSRDGDIGADPESVWYLQPSYCSGNNIRIGSGRFTITDHYEERVVSGTMPEGVTMQMVDFEQVKTLEGVNMQVESISAPVLHAVYKLKQNETCYYQWLQGPGQTLYGKLETLYDESVAAIEKMGGQVRLNTPDPWINNLGAALVNAGNAIWDTPTYMHGAIAWRMRLPAWRGASVADPLGWHNLAKTHFSSYAKSQVTMPLSGPVVMDTALHLARHLEKIGFGMFTSGYICRNPNGDIKPHHYDMNLVFIDQLLSHFEWTGDTAFLREMWPVITRHLDWEKRNFDSDGDGLYDAYCCIWASDGLEYAGGGVTHSSSYNYRAFSKAAILARVLGCDGAAYQQEANKIYQALQTQLWLKDRGWFAEYKDLLGNKLVHPSAGLWTIYHAMDSKLPDAFQAYQMMRYVDTEIPHIPVRAKGLDGNYHVLSTTNWMPYTWSVNNVALAELMHTSLAYWQAGRGTQAFNLWKSALIESMYLGANPGGFHQLSFYDAMRGELYRDFADGIGMTARALVEGLFGIRPDALADTLTIVPGYPGTWDFAQFTIPDVQFDFKRKANMDYYTITQAFAKPMHIKLKLNARASRLPVVKVNGVAAKAIFLSDAVGAPQILVHSPQAVTTTITIEWQDNLQIASLPGLTTGVGRQLSRGFGSAKLLSFYDPQGVLKNTSTLGNRLKGMVQAAPGHKTLFVQLKQGDAIWWAPLEVEVQPMPRHVAYDYSKPPASNTQFEMVNMQSFFNARLSEIFEQKYLSPRPASPALQIPWQGIGNWCYPLATANINDSGFRAKAMNNFFETPFGFGFATPAQPNQPNIAFVSQWDNYPVQIDIPLVGKASHAFFLMAGTTNHMQSQFENARIVVTYHDGTVDSLPLVNPENWWPVEQDYFEDGYAFARKTVRPPRVLLKNGSVFTKPLPQYSSIKGLTNFAIDGGAATVLDMPLNPAKELKKLSLHAIANEVVAGLMGVTLKR